MTSPRSSSYWTQLISNVQQAKLRLDDLTVSTIQLKDAMRTLNQEREKQARLLAQSYAGNLGTTSSSLQRYLTTGTGLQSATTGRFVSPGQLGNKIKQAQQELENALAKYEDDVARRLLNAGQATLSQQYLFRTTRQYGYYPSAATPAPATLPQGTKLIPPSLGSTLFAGQNPNTIAQQLTGNVLNPNRKIGPSFGGNFSTMQLIEMQMDLDKFISKLRQAGVAWDDLQLKFSSGKSGKQVEAQFMRNNQVIDTFVAKVNQAGQVTTSLTPQAPKFTPQELNALTQNYGEAFALVKQYGFARENLTQVERDANSQVTRLTFSYRDQEGVLQKARVNVDQYGRAVFDSQKRFRTFGSTIIRNIREVAGWSVAISLVYGPLYKLQELVTTAIDNQAKLAEVSILLGNAQRDLNDIFDSASTVANATASNINGVLQAYDDAYRAVGSLEDPVERTTAATKLLNDAVTLSTLSTLDQSEAIDVLAGSLRQLQAPGESFNDTLNRSTELLDRWTYLTTIANVSLETLATGFSITAETGVNAFDDVDEGINFVSASIASLSEKIGALGAEETGNALRAIISGFSSDKASKELEKFGISVRDSEGRLRSWIDIASEVSSLFSQGVITSDQLNQISFAIGGGNRRGQQVAAFLSDLDRIAELQRDISDGANTQGFAQQALAVKLETVQAATTKLGNAFQSLAQTLGTDGGLLDLLTTVIELGTDLVNVFNNVTKALGDVGLGASVLPTLALGAGALYYSSFPGGFQGQGGIAYRTLQQNIGAPFGNIAQTVSQPLLRTFGNPYLAGERAANIGAGVRNFVGGNAFGALTSLPAVAQQVQQGEYDRAGGILGSAIVGTILAGGNPIGGLIGTAIATAFVENVLTRSDEVSDYLFPEERQPVAEGEAGFSTRIGIREEARLRAAQNLGEGLGLGGPTSGLLVDIVSFLGSTGIGPYSFGEGLTPEEITNVLAGFPAEERQRTSPVTETEPLSNFFVNEIQTPLADAIRESAREFRETRSAELADELRSGETGLTRRQYTQSRENLLTLTQLSSKFYAAGGEEYDALNQSVSGFEETIQNIFELVTDLTPETREELSQLATDIELITNQIQEARKRAGEGGVGLVQWGGSDLGIEEAEQVLQGLRDQFALTAVDIRRSTELAAENIPELFGLGAREQDLPLIFDEYENIKSAIFEQLTPTEREKRENEIALSEAILEIVDGAGRNVYQRLEGYDTGYLQQAFQNLLDEGLIADQGGIDFQRLGITREEFQSQVVPRYESTLQELRSLGYDPQGENIESLITLFESGEIEVNTYDWKVIQLLLEEANDLNRKQLDGIYNLPANASFYVPFTGYQLGNFEEGGGTTPLGEPSPRALGEPYNPKTDGTYTPTEAKRVGFSVVETANKLLERIRDPRLQDFFNENPEARTLPPNITEDTVPGSSYRDIQAVTLPPVNTNITLNATHNITLQMDSAVLSRLISQQLGKQIKTTSGYGGSSTRFNVY